MRSLPDSTQGRLPLILKDRMIIIAKGHSEKKCQHSSRDHPERRVRYLQERLISAAFRGKSGRIEVFFPFRSKIARSNNGGRVRETASAGLQRAIPSRI
jgi:hypothetical protein